MSWASFASQACSAVGSFASLLPKIDSKYEVPMFTSTRFEDSDHSYDYFNEIHTFPTLPAVSQGHKIK